MPPSREPWIKLKIGIRRSDKMAMLPSSDAKLGWIYTLLEAKVQRQMGVFVNRGHLADLLGLLGAFVDDYLAAELLEVAPDLCPACAVAYEEIRPGQLAVHDFLVEQRHSSPGVATEAGPSAGAIRQARYRLRLAVLERDSFTCRYCGRDDYERDWLIAEHVDPDGPTEMENLVTACRSCNKLKGHRTPEQAGMTPRPLSTVTRNGDGSHGNGDASRPIEPAAAPAAKGRRDASRDASDSRARGTTVTATATVTETDEQKNVLDEAVVETTVGTERATSSPAPFLSDPSSAGRPDASEAIGPARTGIAVPTRIAELTPRWRHVCTDYVRHQSYHRIVDGIAECTKCEEAIALAGGNGAADPGEVVSIWGPVQ